MNAEHLTLKAQSRMPKAKHDQRLALSIPPSA
jgi:hypothetical protein